VSQVKYQKCVTSEVSKVCHKISVKSLSQVKCQECVTSEVSKVCHK